MQKWSQSPSPLSEPVRAACGSADGLNIISPLDLCCVCACSRSKLPMLHGASHQNQMSFLLVARSLSAPSALISISILAVTRPLGLYPEQATSSARCIDPSPQSSAQGSWAICCFGRAPPAPRSPPARPSPRDGRLYILCASSG